VLCSLARSIEAKDPYTEGHCDRLRATRFHSVKKIGLSKNNASPCAVAESFMTIGKVAVPE